jgi:hypothetical protein
VKKMPPKLDAEESKLLTKIMTLGNATNLPVVMTTIELAKLIGVVYRDTGRTSQLEKARPGISTKIVPIHDYYSVPDAWFLAPIDLSEVAPLV